ncbi:helix-turn-helix domain-containing protein [Salinibaculum salinum]|uniref:helix-turn-helix domain-containing protein n=1 Tax=Salinibaculum salinum TaxID=3131996 RepID=UPI0030EF7354
MRYVTLRVSPTEGEAFHPLGRALSADEAVERGNIHRVEMLDDGSGLLLAEARGDVERYREILDESEHVHEFSIVEDEGWWYSYTHFEPNNANREMLELQYESELAMETPIEVEEDGSFVLTLVGPMAAFREATPTDTDAYTVEVLETGEHHPELGDLFLSLTERQRDVLEAATDLGYYDNPRQATHEDIAAEVDASPSTVGEHLRKVESRVFTHLVR